MVNPDGSRGRRRDASRAFARRLAVDSIASGNDTGWFETLYAAAGQGMVVVPWADLAPNRGVVSALTGVRGNGRAIVTGCGRLHARASRYAAKAEQEQYETGRLRHHVDQTYWLDQGKPRNPQR